MKREKTTLPPPKREAKRQLSLKAAMAAATGGPGAIVKPLMDPLGEFPELHGSDLPEVEARLLELQADIINREALLSEQEKRLEHWERELSEREALLEAHRNLLESRTGGARGADGAEEDLENDALLKLKRELDAQEKSLKETRELLKEREAYIEQCENELVEKSMLLTEREARVEQREEDLAGKAV